MLGNLALPGALSRPAVDFAAPSVEVVRDAQALTRLAPAWQDLAAHSLEANPLYEPFMLLPALQSSAENDVEVALVWGRPAGRRAAPRLDGLVPLQRVRRFKGLPLTALVAWRHRSWLLGTPLVRRGSERTCIATLLGWAENQGASWLELECIPCEGAFHGALADVLAAREARFMITQSFTRACLRRRPSLEAHLAKALSGDTRKGLRRKERRLSEQGSVSHVVLGPQDDVEPWIDEFLRLEASGWKGRRGSAMACSEAGRRFAYAMLREAHRSGRLQIVGINFDGRAVARCCNLVAGEGAYAYRCAYDEDFAPYSPGIMAEIDTIRAFYASPELRWMDSITDPDNATLNRLWNGRRTMQDLVVGLGAYGELCASLLPLLMRLKRSWRAPRARTEGKKQA